MRNSECGMRNRSGMSRAPTPTRTFRILHSAFRILVFVAACTPITTRPDFRPDPRALIVILDARPERVTAALDSLVPAESLEVAHSSVRDGYVETAWYDTQAHRSRHHEREIANLGATVKTRFWADPWVPGQTRLTIEPLFWPLQRQTPPGEPLPPTMLKSPLVNKIDPELHACFSAI